MFADDISFICSSADNLPEGLNLLVAELAAWGLELSTV
jgi:hypothetical protein